VTHMIQIHRPLTILTVAVLAACGSGAAVAQERKTASQKTFDSPEAAVQALIDATSKNDTAELVAVLGSNGQGILTSGDAGQDQAERREFAQLASTRHRLEPSTMRAGTMILLVGEEAWPFPVPLVSVDQRWHFDPALGALEVRARRVGANELDAIEICAGYVEAQQAYAAQHRSGAATMEYAKAIVSSPGQKNGLYQPGASPELVPQGFADAAMDPGAQGQAVPRLLFPCSYRTRTKRAWRAAQIRGGAIHDRGLRAGGLACAIWRDRCPHLHRESGQCGLRKGPGPSDAQSGSGSGALRSRQFLDSGRLGTRG